MTTTDVSRGDSYIAKRIDEMLSDFENQCILMDIFRMCGRNAIQADARRSASSLAVWDATVGFAEDQLAFPRSLRLDAAGALHRSSQNSTWSGFTDR
jgi:hypothetical protein